MRSWDKDMGRLRGALRWGALLLGAGFAAWDMPEALYNFRHWRAAAPDDPAAAEFWGVALRMDATEIAAALGAAVVLWLALRPRKKVAGKS